MMQFYETAEGISWQGLFFKKAEDLSIEAYIDTNWASSVTNRRSMSRYCTFVCGNSVTWRSEKANACSSIQCGG